MGSWDNQYGSWSNYYSHEQVTKRREEEERKRRRERDEKQRRLAAEKKKAEKKQEAAERLKQDEQAQEDFNKQFGVGSSGEEAGEKNWGWVPEEQRNKQSGNGGKPLPRLQRGGFSPFASIPKLNPQNGQPGAPGPAFGPQAYQRGGENKGPDNKPAASTGGSRQSQGSGGGSRGGAGFGKLTRPI